MSPNTLVQGMNLLHGQVASDLACLVVAWKDVVVPKPYPSEFRDDVVCVARGLRD